jgi:hypothetical protein
LHGCQLLYLHDVGNRSSTHVSFGARAVRLGPSGAGILVRGGDLSWGIPDEDITSMDMHEASPLDIQPIQGPITRARARQLNLEVSSFLSVPINNFNNDLLPIVYNVIRNQGEDQEIHGGRLGGVEGQQGDPLQLKFESNLGSRSCLR